MSHPVPDAAISVATSEIPIEKVISEELSAVRNSRAGLMTGQVHPRIHIGIILVCIGINLMYFFYRTDYMVLFIAASFYVNMYYFIIVLVLQNVQKSTRPESRSLLVFEPVKRDRPEIGYNPFYKVVYQYHFFEQQDAVTRNLPDICYRYSLCDVGILLHGSPAQTDYHRHFPVCNYSCILSPGVESETFLIEVCEENRYLFLIGFLFAAIVFFTTIIILPGITLSEFLTQSRLSELGDLFVLLAVLAISQYFIVRSIHGSTSRTMAGDFFDYKENLLLNLRDIVKSDNNS